MKIILSVESIKFPLTGVGRYTFELAKQLQLQGDFELKFFANGKFLNNLPIVAESNSNINEWLHNRLRKNDLAILVNKLWSGIRNHYSLKDHGDAIFHGTGFYLPQFNGPCVATFHDLSVFKYAQCHPPERVRYMQRELNFTFRRASMLITDSEYTRQELTSYFGYPLERIRAISLACSDDFHPREAVDTFSVLKRYELVHGGYTLYAGTIEPRKNIEALLDAYSLLPEAIRQRWPLVLVGYHGWQTKQLHEHIKLAESAGWLRYLGYVADEDLPHLFAGASLFLFPSHYEGFGLPVLEAMASGVPVICSNTSSLPEVAGDAALMFDPEDVDTLVSMILIGLEDEVWRKTAKEKGLMQASNFSWKRCAEETITVYRELLF